MSDKSTWIEDGTTTFGRVAAGIAGIGLVVLFAFGWRPPDWLTAGLAGILFYCGIMIAIGQLGELVWRRIKSKF
jgi:hypothetical protein